MRRAFLLSLGLLAAGAAHAETGTPTTGATYAKKPIPRLFRRALGLETSTVAQTEAQTPAKRPWSWYHQLPEALVQAELEARHAEGGDTGALVERVTRGLLGAPYLLSSHGEGEGFDPDPRWRLDAFDCTTFVETAVALTWRDELGQAAHLLDDIRYTKGKVGFDSRRHLMTSQWIPGLIADGFLEDVTRRVGGKQTRAVKLDLSKDRWEKRTIARALKLPAAHIPFGTHPLDYLPIEVALARLDDLPSGAILNVVRADWRPSPDVITHQGLLLRRPDRAEPLVRHASPISRRVIDEPLRRMLERYRDKPRKWKVIGVNLLRIRHPD